MENLENGAKELAISIRVEDANQVSNPEYEQQKVPQSVEENQAIKIKSKK